MGDWYLKDDGSWVYDKDAPSPGTNPSPTEMLPIVTPSPTRRARTFTHDDGSEYERVSAAEFDSFDEVDSTTIADPGAPQWP